MSSNTGQGGMDRAVITHSSGSTLEVYLYGGCITSFKTAAGQELFFVSTKAVFDGVKPIRGGVPIAFPQFASQGPLPQHGFARNSLWKLDETGNGHAVLSLRDTEATRGVWPHSFVLRLRILFDDNHLTTHLDIENPSGAPAPFAWEALQHSYFAIGQDAISSVRVCGLKGVTFLSKPDGGAAFVEESDAIQLAGEVDRIYCNTPADVRVTGITSGAGLPSGSRVFDAITVKRRGALRPAPALSNAVESCPVDVVVWNPGPERAKAIADLGDDDWRHYVCIEPGRVSPDTAAHHAASALRPGKAYTLTQEVVLHYAA